VNNSFLVAFLFGSVCWAARCTTTPDSRALAEYDSYVTSTEPARVARFAAAELAWVPDSARKQAARELDSGKPVRWNVSPPSNGRIADWNASVVHWIGAIRIQRTTLADLKAVLQDYAHHTSIYRPLIYECQAQPVSGPATAYDVSFGLQSVYRFGAILPQRYAFQLKARIDYSEAGSPADPVLMVHQHASEIRESDSGVPGRNDFLESYHDHGILWGLNTYWLARQEGPDLYVEFEAITLARSLRDFACKLGILPVSKSIASSVMDTLPGESVELMLTATKAECERRKR
jgi:hypothetical protein